MSQYVNVYTNIHECGPPFFDPSKRGVHNETLCAKSEIVMVDLALGDDAFEQDRAWDDSGTSDHFRDLRYPPNFHNGQDAGFDSGSSS